MRWVHGLAGAIAAVLVASGCGGATTGHDVARKRDGDWRYSYVAKDTGTYLEQVVATGPDDAWTLASMRPAVR